MGGSDVAWKIPGYVAVELLGYGASGEVWRGRTVRTGTPVALKRVAALDAVGRRAAQTEAALLSALDHPHLIRLHELVPTPEAMVLVLDLAAGGSLSDLLERRGRLAAGEVSSVLAPVAAALAYAHDEGVVHADVSAANVLLTEHGSPLLSDLGVARLLAQPASEHATLAYIDPTVAAGGAPGAQTDVFMLAAVALHALTGQPPWIGTDATEVLALAASGEIPDLERRLAGIDGAMADVVRRGLSTLPYARGTAAEFALDLRHASTPIPVELAGGRPRADTLSGRPLEPPPSPPRAPGVGPTKSAQTKSAQTKSAQTKSAQTKSAQTQWSGPRHAVGIRATAVPVGGAGRPDFIRPVLAPCAFGPDGAARTEPRGEEPDEPAQWLTMTHQVRARVREPLPPTSRGQRAVAILCSVGRVRATVALVVVLVVLAGSLLLWHRAGPGQADPAARGVPATSTAPTVGPQTSTSPTSTSPTSTRSTSTRSTSTSSTSTTPTPPWTQILAALDAEREQAFATGDPVRLAAVYLAGPLLQQDTAALSAAVPSGCGLAGLRTTYAGVRATRDAGGVTLSARASLAAATLSCHGAPAGTTPPRPSVRMTIRLVSTPAGFRIGALTMP